MKGVMPYVPKVLPAVIPDPAVRRRAEEAFLSEDFKNNIETYFVDNIKVLKDDMILKWSIKTLLYIWLVGIEIISILWNFRTKYKLR